MSPVPTWLLSSSAFLREVPEEDVDMAIEDIPSPEPLTSEALDELQKFVEEGTIVWTTQFWKLVAYFMLDGWESTLDAHIRRYGPDRASVVVDAKIGKFDDWLDPYTCEMSKEGIVHKGMFYRWPDAPCNLWVKYGHLDCLKWARENGCPWDRSTCECAALHGHLDCLKWLRKNKCPSDAWTCAYAALNGHLKCLKWLRTDGCPWDKQTCSYAVANGHLDCLRWAHKNGCPWGRLTCAEARFGRSLDCVKYARDNGCPE